MILRETKVQAAYRYLGLTPGASKDEINKSWHRLMKDVHTDTHPEIDPEIAKRINEAHDILIAYIESGLNFRFDTTNQGNSTSATQGATANGAGSRGG